jgi:hypothetical protein
VFRDGTKTIQTGEHRADAQQWFRDANMHQKHICPYNEDPTVREKKMTKATAMYTNSI